MDLDAGGDEGGGGGGGGGGVGAGGGACGTSTVCPQLFALKSHFQTDVRAV